MKVEQVQVDVSELIKGMYVCALDRPWLSTPFPFQGFVIRNDTDIAELQKHCNFVYVDVLRGVPPAPSATPRGWKRDEGDASEPVAERASSSVTDSAVRASAARQRSRAVNIKSVPLRVDHERYEPPRALRKELRKALVIHRDLSRSMGRMIDDIRVGRGLEVKNVRQTTGQMVDSIIRHPDALIWLGRLRETDGYAYSHSIRSSIMSVAMARHLGLPEPQMQRLAMGTLLCEIGKAKLPRHLLEKKDPLTDIEIERVQDHVVLGVELLGRCTGMDDEVLEVVQTHHERFDGTGYPNGLHGDQIPLLGRIAGMIDCYDAMTSEKPYTDRIYSTAQAIDYFFSQRDHEFQAQLVDEFIQAIGLYPTGTLVELSNGEIGMVLAQEPTQRLQPEILIVLDADRRPIDPPRKVDLREQNARATSDPVSIQRALLAGEYGLDAAAILEAHANRRWDWRKLGFRD
ncbi:MAG: HD-GYP domain-containing protein [Pseudomonadota bacterium]